MRDVGSVAVGLPRGFYGRRVILVGTVDEQVQQHGRKRCQQDAGLNQWVQVVRHPLLEVGRDQGNHADTHRDGHHQAVESS